MEHFWGLQAKYLGPTKVTLVYALWRSVELRYDGAFGVDTIAMGEKVTSKVKSISEGYFLTSDIIKVND